MLKRKINEENKQTKQQKAHLNEFSQVVYLFSISKIGYKHFQLF